MLTRRCMRLSLLAILGCWLASSWAVAEDEPVWLVRAGQPRAQIIIAAEPPRAVPVAARELQAYLQKISGAVIPIHNVPDDSIPTRIYVGRSPHTDALKISNEDLDHGAFRMVSGDQWLALVGRDRDYEFREPYARTLDDKARVQAEWEQIAGGKWYHPYGTQPLRHYNAELNLWYLDECGSIHAVYRFLHDLGVRWYLPDALGEVVPQQPDIALPKVDRTVRPDFALRYPHSSATFRSTPEALWALRMGWSPAADLAGPYGTTAVAHGITRVALHPENRAAHPEFFAVLNGKRYMPEKNPSFCLSSPELIDQNVRYLRAVFDTFDPWMVSVQPADSNVLVCQCELCAGKGTPERGRRGSASDYVWEYIQRVAVELYKTHPNKKIAALAYANYQLPPTRIDQLSPNILVGAPSGRTFTHNNEAEVKLVEEIRRQWLEKLPEGSKQIYHYEYFMDARPGRRTESLPVFVMHSVARSLRQVRGVSIGEHIDVARYPNGLVDLGVMHLNLYVTSKLWWDAQQDVDALLEEYYTLYYGPAREPMKQLIEFSEAHWPRMPSEPALIGRYLELLAAAQAAAPADSVYARRIDLLARYTEPMRALMQKVAMGRDESVPPIVMRGPRPAIKADDIRIDGKLDEDVWQHVPGKATAERLNLPTFHLREVVSGAEPVHATKFNVFWADGALYMGIRCQDADAANLNIATRDHEDAAIWKGDLVEVHLETQTHSYYALVINPAGAMLDLDWKDRAREVGWNSNAQVATHIGEDGWTIELRIPVVDEMESAIVELGSAGVVGRQPTKLHPWYINIVRQRLRDDDKEVSAYSPIGSHRYHNPSKFARLSGAR